MIKTTRLKPTQVPKNITFDLTDQVDGERQTFTLPQKCYDIDTHYVLFNGQVYRNDDNATYYSISDDGMTLTTYFDTPPLPGASHVLQFVKTDDTEAEGNVATESYVDNAVSVLQGEIDTIVAASDVRDIVGTHADLEAYDTSTLGDNDIIKVLVDETQDDKTSYYRWSTSTETFTLIGTLGPFQGVLTAGANITIDANNEISAIDTTYDAFTGTDGVDPGVAGLVPAPAVTDADKYLKSDGTWATVAAGPTIVQTYGTSQTDVMSQKATTDLVYTAGDPKKINIGDNGVTGATNSIIIGSEDSGTITGAADQIIIGHDITCDKSDAIAIGHTAKATSFYTVAIGNGAKASYLSAVSIGRSSTASGESSVSVGAVSSATTEGVAVGCDASAAAYAVALGYSAHAPQDGVCILGQNYWSNSNFSVVIGRGARMGGAYPHSIALGSFSTPRAQGVMDISTSVSGTAYGYQGANDQTRTNLRVISGVHDGEQLHDAATVAQGNTLATSAPTTTTAGVLGQLYTDTTAMHTYQCTAIDTTDPDNPVYTWTQRW